MSQASRERERLRRALYHYRGHATLEALRAYQAVALPQWLMANAGHPTEDTLVRDAYGRVSQPPRWFSAVVCDTPMVYPETVMEEAA